MNTNIPKCTLNVNGKKYQFNLNSSEDNTAIANSDGIYECCNIVFLGGYTEEIQITIEEYECTFENMEDPDVDIMEIEHKDGRLIVPKDKILYIDFRGLYEVVSKIEDNEPEE
jgi:hypothetical protein